MEEREARTAEASAAAWATLALLAFLATSMAAATTAPPTPQASPAPPPASSAPAAPQAARPPEPAVTAPGLAEPALLFADGGPSDDEDEYHAQPAPDLLPFGPTQPELGPDLLLLQPPSPPATGAAATLPVATAPAAPDLTVPRPTPPLPEQSAAGRDPDQAGLGGAAECVVAVLDRLGIEAQPDDLDEGRALRAPGWLSLSYLARRVRLGLEAAGLPVAKGTCTRTASREELRLALPGRAGGSLVVWKPPARSRVGLIVDDVGAGGSSTARLLELDLPLTFAIIPFLRGSSAAAHRAQERGFDVILHMPMEPHRFRRAVDGATAIMHGLAPEEMVARLDRALASLPAGTVVGVNNHMGSLLTEDPTAMRALIEEVGRRDLFFVDSETSRASVAWQVARLLGVRSARRNIEFIDNKPAVAYAVGQFRTLAARGAKPGSIVCIMHDRPTSIAALERQLPQLLESGLEFTLVAELVDGGVRGQQQPETYVRRFE